MNKNKVVLKRPSEYGLPDEIWDYVAISEVCFFQEGPGLRNWQWREEGMKAINITNILGDGRVDTSNTDKFISLHEFEDKYRHFGVQCNDIVMASSGWSYGKVGKIKEENLPLMMNTSVIRFRSKRVDVLDDGYLYAFLRSPFMKIQVDILITGVDKPNFGSSHIKRMSIPLPPLPTQQKIASILSAYDDLIENNLKRIRLLEEAAQHLYREWFVKFRFPGWEEVEVVDGLPVGWGKYSFFDVAEIMSGGTPKTDRKDFWDGDIPFFTPKDGSGNNSIYINQTERRVTEEGLKNCNSRLYPKNTVFITARGTVGRICLAAVPMAMSQSSFALAGKDGTGPFFLCSALQNSVEKIKKFAIGGVFDTIIVDTFKKIECLKPTKELIYHFEKIVTPMFSQIETLHLQNQKLKEARDNLLPRLMNQTIEV